MPQKVPYDSICMAVVKEWQRLMQETAEERGDNLSIVQPWHVYEQTYPEIITDVRKGSYNGLEFYRLMVKSSVGFSFSEGVPCDEYCKHVQIKQ